jgi:hypothetical protein
MRWLVQKTVPVDSLSRESTCLLGVDEHGTIDIVMTRQLGRTYLLCISVWPTSDNKVRKPNGG